MRMSRANDPRGELSYVNNGGRSLWGRDSRVFRSTVAAVWVGRMNKCSLWPLAADEQDGCWAVPQYNSFPQFKHLYGVLILRGGGISTSINSPQSLCSVSETPGSWCGTAGGREEGSRTSRREQGSKRGGEDPEGTAGHHQKRWGAKECFSLKPGNLVGVFWYLLPADPGYAPWVI